MRRGRGGEDLWAAALAAAGFAFGEKVGRMIVFF